MTKLTVKQRENLGKTVRHLRAEGMVPAAMYGPKYSSSNVMVDAKNFKKAFEKSGYSKFVDVEVEDGETEKTLVKEVQQNPVTDEILHVSFYVIDAKTEITAEIPVEFTGKSPVEDLGEGFVAFALNSIHVRCLPKDLPSGIQVDITKLEKAGESILVEDIKLPEGVELDTKTDPFSALAYVATAQKIEDVLAEIEADKAEAAAEGEEGAEGEVAEGTEEGAGTESGEESEAKSE